MVVFTYSQARQNLARVLDQSKEEQVIIRRRGGDCFVVVARPREGSPFDVPGVRTQATTAHILAAVRESRCRSSGHQRPRRRRA